MGKDAVKTDSKKEQSTDQSKNIMDKILKNKNRFRSGLGFKQGKALKDDEKAKISQGISRKKILQGTRGDKTHEDEDEFNGDLQDTKKPEDFELGSRNFVTTDDADENTTLSQQAFQKKAKYFDPRTAFLEKIKQDADIKS